MRMINARLFEKSKNGNYGYIACIGYIYDASACVHACMGMQTIPPWENI